ncbi:MAG TPA: hypothetical protein VF183_07375 [Acidimicrobiales bacterium]
MRRPLTDLEVIHLLESVNGAGGELAARDYAALLLALFTGLRRAALAAIDVGRTLAFDDSADYVVLQNAPGVGVDKVRQTPLAREIWDMLLPYRIGRGPAGPLFPVTADGLHYALDRRARNVGIEDFTMDALRQKFLAWCRDAGLARATIATVDGSRNRGRRDTWQNAARKVYDAVAPRLGLVRVARDHGRQ